MMVYNRVMKLKYPSVLMVKLVRIFGALVMVFGVVTFGVSDLAFADDVTLTDEQTGAISQNCASIKQQLRTLQRTDARTRSYLGSAYEKALSDFIAPMDVRLINAGQPNSSLTELHSKIISVRQDFIHDYTAYSQSLEELINQDCQNNPAEFYHKLAETREKRATLAKTNDKLRKLLSDHLTAVQKLKKGDNE